MIKLKRAYEAWDRSDGYRVLVDRLWPRGVSKTKAHLDLWLKDIAPSSGLRQWFGHDPVKWSEFGRRYRQELTHNPEEMDRLKTITKEHPIVTLVYGAKDRDHNEAIVLKRMLE